jgi:hypothetical protein
VPCCKEVVVVVVHDHKICASWCYKCFMSRSDSYIWSAESSLELLASLTPFMSCFNHKSSLEDLVCSSTYLYFYYYYFFFFFFFFFYYYYNNNNNNNNSCWCVMDTWLTHGPLPKLMECLFVPPWESSTAALMDCPVPLPTHTMPNTPLWQNPFSASPTHQDLSPLLYYSSPYQCWLAGYWEPQPHPPSRLSTTMRVINNLAPCW